MSTKFYAGQVDYIEKLNEMDDQVQSQSVGLATVATTGSYTDLVNKPSLFSGSYVDLSNKPSFSTVAFSGAYADLTGKPVIPTANSQLTNDAGFITQAGARTAISVAGDLSYNSTTGVISYTTTAPSSTDLLTEGTSNLYFTYQRVRDTVLSGLDTTISTVATAGDSVLSAIGKLQKQISNLVTSLGNKVDTSSVGNPNGVASLDNSGRLPAGQLPSNVATTSTVQNAQITVKNQGATLTGAPASMNFTGSQLTASVDGSNNVTVAHSDINIVSCTVNTPPYVVSGYDVVWKVSGASMLAGGSIASFKIVDWNNTTHTITASNNSGTFSLLATGSVGTVLPWTVTATDNLGNTSLFVNGSTTISVDHVPTGTITSTIQSQVATNTIGNQCSFTGLSTDDGVPFTYTIVQTGQMYPLTFSKTSGIADSEIITFSTPDVTASGADQSVTFSVYGVDATGGQSSSQSFTVTILASTVIGVVLKTGGNGGGTWGQIDVSGNDITAQTTTWFNSYGPTNLQAVTVAGRSMISVPKFYYKVGTISGGTNNGKTAWWISNLPRTGFALHPAFMNAGSAVNQFYIDANQSTTPVSITIATARSNASALNTGGVTGFMLLSFWQVNAILFLYLVEKMTMGTSDPVSYRGINNMADGANVSPWMDGVSTDASANVQVWDTSGNKTYVNTSLKGNPVVNFAVTWPLTFQQGALDAGFVGNTYVSTTQSSGTTTNPSAWVASSFGSWGFKSSSGSYVPGPFTFDIEYSSTGTSSTVGQRFAKY